MGNKTVKNEETTLSEARCMKCNKLLGKLKGTAEIKCPKCKSYNSISK